MCRHLAWVGEPVTLASLILEPAFSLLRQSYAPRHQQHGVVNADGFGVGWYPGTRPEPVRYRRAQPIWGDSSFASLAPTIASRCVLGAVRDATPGFASSDESSAAPFTHGRWLFSHTGALADWPRARKALLDRTLDIPEAAAPVDSALLFGVAVSAWSAGASLAEGLAESLQAALGAGGGRLSFLATDGERVAATCYGDPLFCHQSAGGVLLASEPIDDSPGWRELPAESQVQADPAGIEVLALNT
ncbi:ergothioneine biosynthesis protein EgtC [Microlunatus panaciterrae]|uniref:Gamma-glutamyl-hercynylcysteine sulfoxide hydrolase n=1 Tax=Microlunatus panaciterrae TaxID=400768 RepID=A0ABS2RLG4_9ACTN|nr:ergothioneine biosynthesis protein EgtC [Microlunatus panaciterrae]MBM7799832.1 glutamine amidotransferase [Microlunatus panaciterrae]